MTQVSLQEAQETLAQLIVLVQQGEEVMIMDKQSAVAQLVAPPPHKWIRVPGRDKGLYAVPDNFDDPLPDEILESFGQ